MIILLYTICSLGYVCLENRSDDDDSVDKWLYVILLMKVNTHSPYTQISVCYIFVRVYFIFRFIISSLTYSFFVWDFLSSTLHLDLLLTYIHTAYTENIGTLFSIKWITIECDRQVCQTFTYNYLNGFLFIKHQGMLYTFKFNIYEYG